MTADPSQPDFEEALLAGFMHELAATSDRSAVVRSYARRHAALADEFTRLEEMNRLIDRARVEASEDQLPTQLGEFRIVRRIARGGMGDIYEAVQDRLNRRVAVKTIRRGRTCPQARDRFFREQRVLARLHQTHIVPIHAAGEEGDLLYFAMPFIDGAPLNQVVRAAAALDPRTPGSKTPSLLRIAERLSGDEPTAAAAPAPAPRTLSAAYFRSVALVVADVAEAVEHAHRLDVLHRDLKPSNIMIDRHGQCWIIDFGLAGYVGQTSERTATEAGDSGEALTTGGLVGTPQYMSPEQWRGEPADARSDVWALGATLYELLTLRRAFDGPTDLDVQNRVLEHEPDPPRADIRNLPLDLSAIARKALNKTPTDRYPTARDLGEDLRRWLRHEPIEARPAWAIRRVALWARRNRGWAAALSLTLAAAVALAGLEIRHEGLAAQFRGEQLMLDLLHVRLGKHSGGWRDDALKRVRDIYHLRPTTNLRDHAAALLTGFDAARTNTFPSGASSAAFDPAGGRMLLGGLNDRYGRPVDGARIADLATGESTIVSRKPGAGPVAFRPDGTALQLVPRAEDRWIVDLWDVARQQTVHSLRLADAQPEAVAQATYPPLALAADGSLAAAATTPPGGKGVLRVWDTQAGKLVLDCEQAARSLAFSQDCTLLAAGDADGEIAIWNLANGERLTVLPSGGRAIQCLSFGRDPWIRKDGAGGGLLLAAADASSRVTVWDLTERSKRCQCFGSWYEINALAFSPDGMALASGGRGPAKLWDVATGRLMLEAAPMTNITGLAFDAHGRRLAVAGSPLITEPANVEVWNLETGRGTVTLTGLVGPIAKTAFSTDGRYVAALSQQWQLGVWDLSAGRLMHVLDVPRGEYVDNAALAFDPAGARLACAGGAEAILWDIATGGRLNHWQLPSGLQDALAFDPAGRQLWSVRCETETRVPPHGHNDPHQHRRIYPVRNLLGPKPSDPITIIRTPDDHIKGIVMPPDASTVVLNTVRKFDGGEQCTVRAFTLPGGTELWHKAAESGDLTLDPLGKLLGFGIDGGGPIILALDSGEPVLQQEGIVGPGGTWWLRASNSLGVEGAVIAGLDIDQQIAMGSQFSPCGRFLAIGRNDGTVVVYQLEAFRKHLAEFGNR